MEPLTIIGSVIAATGAGLGVGVGARLLPIAFRAHRDLRVLKHSEGAEHYLRIAEHEEERLRLWCPSGRKRESSIAGISDGALRHTDGSYTCAWEAQPAPTMLAHEHVVESRCDELARMLAADKLPGTVIQFRFSSGPDPGAAIVKHLAPCDDISLAHPEAARLHAMNVNFYATLRPIVGGKTVEVEFADGIRLSQILQELITRFPPLRTELFDENDNLHGHVHVFLNGRDSTFLPLKLNTPVSLEDMINIFPAVGGG